MVTSTKKSITTKETKKPTIATASKKVATPHVQPTKTPTKREVPTLIKVLAVFNFIGAAADMIFGLIFILAAQFMASTLQDISLIATLGSSIFIALGILLFALGILSFFIGKGLWKGQNWARITLIVMHVLGIPFGLYSIIMGNYLSIISLMISLAILGYLVLSEDVKKAFV